MWCWKDEVGFWGSPGHNLTLSHSPRIQQVARGDNGETFSGVAHRDQDYEIVPTKDLKTVFLSALLVDDWLFVIGNWPIQDVVITIHAWRTLQADDRRISDSSWHLLRHRGDYADVRTWAKSILPHNEPSYAWVVTAEPLSVQLANWFCHFRCDLP